MTSSRRRILVYGGSLIAMALWFGVAKMADYATIKDNLLRGTQVYFTNQIVSPDSPGVIRSFPVVLAKEDPDVIGYEASASVGLVKHLSDQAYDLTEEGKRFYWSHNNWPPVPGFRAFQIEVLSIDAFGKPERRDGYVFGSVFRDVTFSYRVHIEEWAKQSVIQKAFEKQLPSKTDVHSMTVPIVLTDIGWVFEELAWKKGPPLWRQ